MHVDGARFAVFPQVVAAKLPQVMGRVVLVQGGITGRMPIGAGTIVSGVSSRNYALAQNDIVNSVARTGCAWWIAFPDQINGNTNAGIIMMAEKAADMILGKPPLAPQQLDANP